jgi:CheY-like chemotaxis protein
MICSGWRPSRDGTVPDTARPCPASVDVGFPTSTEGQSALRNPTEPGPGTPHPRRAAYNLRVSTSEHRRSVLIVEDDEDIRAAMAELLESEGFDVTVASNGQEGLEVLDQMGPPCLVLLDLMMPVMNGEDFLRHVRSNPSLNPVAIVIVTASGKAPLPGTQGLLKKPFEISDLFATVTAHCG